MKKFNFFCMVFILCTMYPSFFFAQETSDKSNEYVTKLQATMVLYNNAALYGKPLDKEVEKSFKELYTMRPDQKQLAAYRGSALLLLARDNKYGLTKLALANQGIGILDKAIKEDNNNYESRIARIASYLELPKFFNKDQVVQEDIDYMSTEYNKDKQEFAKVLDPAWILYYKAMLQNRGKEKEVGLTTARDALAIATTEPIRTLSAVLITKLEKAAKEGK